ncbi:MAG: STAS-like domain-containing protein [Isosphaeraceae bacterium]
MDDIAEVRMDSDGIIVPNFMVVIQLALEAGLAEDEVWDHHFDAAMRWLPENVQRVCYYGFTEILNNAIDHSSGTNILCWAEQNSDTVVVGIADNGIGIFEKIKTYFGLDDHRHAILELCKGKLTTDQSRHTGEGIFFASRMFDDFMMRANHLGYCHSEDGDWLIEVDQKPEPGTVVTMEIRTDSKRTTREVFDMFADPSSGDFTFSKTHVPLVLAKQHGSRQLVSRSEAKRVLTRFQGFKEVLLDFAGIDSIGPSFADEIFRVFHQANPDIRIVAWRASESVAQMIARAQSGAAAPPMSPA